MYTLCIPAFEFDVMIAFVFVYDPLRWKMINENTVWFHLRHFDWRGSCFESHVLAAFGCVGGSFFKFSFCPFYVTVLG